VLRAGVAAFALAQLLVGVAPSMPVLVAGRALSGVAEALLDISLMVLVARVLPRVLRPRMMSVFAASWVLPSVLGPLATGVVTETAGWRWVFLGALGLLVPTWLTLRPAVPAAEEAPAGEEAVGRTEPPATGWATAAAMAVFALTLAGMQLATHPGRAVVELVVAGLGLGISAVRLLPVGTLRAAPGLPTVVAIRALVAGAFGGVGAFLPLLLTLLHGFPPSRAGVSLSITGVMWAVGSWLQGRDHGLPRTRVLRVGLSCITVGLTLAGLLVAPGSGPWWGLAGWAVAGLGMGLSSSSLSVLLLDLSAAHEQGRNAGAAQTGASTSIALAFAVGGSLLAVAGPHRQAEAFGAIVLGGAGCALFALVLSSRLGPTEPPAARRASAR
jgi:MFS family permease